MTKHFTISTAVDGRGVFFFGVNRIANGRTWRVATFSTRKEAEDFVAANK